jgi:hypothetical protein
MEQPQLLWTLTKFDAPDGQHSFALGQFLLEQSGIEGNPPGKDTYLPWKLSYNYVHGGFATAIIETSSSQHLSLCTITPKRL